MRRIFYVVLFSILVAACAEKEDADSRSEPQSQEPYVVRCTEPLPEFSLGNDSQPTESQEAALCSCVWENLGGWERETAKAISEGNEAQVSNLNMRAFPSRFGSAVEKCGGMGL